MVNANFTEVYIHYLHVLSFGRYLRSKKKLHLLEMINDSNHHAKIQE